MEGEMGVTKTLGDFMLSGMCHVAMDVGSALDHGYGMATGGSARLVYQEAKLSADFGAAINRYIAGDEEIGKKLWGQMGIPVSRNHSLFCKMAHMPRSKKSWSEITIGFYSYF